ncbi:SWIM zinc finger family protein [Paenibacillus sp. y28]|uniref:SWIM zinc finger family protein n=1 Tax=Paenibacillus sp. y28 TaxID=3129110 RepID=UPI003016E631
MNPLTESYVDSLALNNAAMKNGKDLVKKNSFPKLCKSEDNSLIFGECKGSGKEPYRCSVDFVKDDNPVFRCSCPSRQFPCKHLLGLMYAFTAGKTFEIEAIPQDIADKRDKAEKREEKKKESTGTETGKPVKRKTNKAALLKKMAAQLEGIGIAEKLVIQLVQAGLGSLDKKTLQTLADQAKQLGNYYIPGVQTALRELIVTIKSAERQEDMYVQAIACLSGLHSLVKKSKTYLQSRIDDPHTAMDMESTLEERLGHAWQLTELAEAGRVVKDAQLQQLAFHSYSDEARGEYVDEGFWMELKSGLLYKTHTYRPFRAAKYIREDDSFYDVLQTKELFVYPGELNPRVRWEEAGQRQPEPADLEAVRSHAHKSYPDVIKLVKNQIKNPLSDKHPVLLVHYAAIQQIGDSFVLLDEQGKQLVCADIAGLYQPTTSLLPLLNKVYLTGQAMLVMFEHDSAQNQLLVQPMSMITANEVVRLLY